MKMAENQNHVDQSAVYYNANVYEEIGENVTGVEIQTKSSPSRPANKSKCSIACRYFLVSFVTFLFCVGMVVVLVVTVAVKRSL